MSKFAERPARLVAVIAAAVLLALTAAACGGSSGGEAVAKTTEPDSPVVTDADGHELLTDDVFEDDGTGLADGTERISEDEGFPKLAEAVCDPVPQGLIDAILPGATLWGDLMSDGGEGPYFEGDVIGSQMMCTWGVGDRAVSLEITYAPKTDWQAEVSPAESFGDGTLLWYRGDNSVIADGAGWPLEVTTTQYTTSSASSAGFALPDDAAAAAIIADAAPRLTANAGLLCSIEFEGPDALTDADELGNAVTACTGD